MKELIENLLQQGVDSLELRVRVFEFADEVLALPPGDASARLADIVPRMSSEAWEVFQTTLGLLAAGYDMEASHALYLNLTGGGEAAPADATGVLLAGGEGGAGQAAGRGPLAERAYFVLREAQTARAAADERGEDRAELPTGLAARTRDDLGKARQLMAIEMQFITAATRAVPGQVDAALIDELKGIEAAYVALLESTPPRFPMYSLEDVRAKIATTQEQIGAAYEVLEAFEEAAQYYELAAGGYEQVWQAEDAERTRRAARRLRQRDDGVTGMLIADLAEPSTPSLQRARLLLDLAARRAQVADRAGASDYLRQMQQMLDTIGQPALTPQEVADSLADSLGQVAAGDLSGSYAVREINEVRLLWQRYHRLLAAIAGSDSEERAHYDRLVQTLDTQVDAALLKLRARLDAVSAELARRQAAGEPPDDLLATVDAIAADGRSLHAVEFDVLVLMQRADVLLSLDRPREAIEGLEMASALLGALREYDLGVALRARLAAAYSLRGDWDVASRLAAEGIRLVEKYRYRVIGTAARLSRYRSRALIYGMAVRAAAARGDVSTALEAAEMAKGRVVLRHPYRPDPQPADVPSLRARLEAAARRRSGARDSALRAAADHAMWEQVVNARYLTRHGDDLPVLSAGAVQAALPADTAVLYYYWAAPDELFIITLDAERIAVERREHTPAEHRLLLLALRTGSAAGETARQAAAAALADLAGYLLPQAEGADLLAGKRRLLISPHHRLHALPFAALPFQGQPLARRFALTRIPGVSVLLLAEPAGGPPVVVIPAEGDEHAAFVTACQGAGRPATVLDAEAPAAALGALAAGGELAAFGLVYVGCPTSSVHGRADGASALRLPDGEVSAVEIAGWALHADAVVLPHASFESDPFPAWRTTAAWSDDVSGLEEAFQAAGARAVVGTLWPADGPAAGAIRGALSRLLAEGLPPADALHAAISAALDQAPDLVERPWEWAGFRVTALCAPDVPPVRAAEAAPGEAVQMEPLPDPDTLLRDVAARVHDPAAAIYQRHTGQGSGVVRFSPAEDLVEYTPLPYRPGPGDTLLLARPVRVIIGLEAGGQVLRAGLELYGDVILGRGESGPEGIIVDLTPYRGIETGVSRQHVMLSPGDGFVTVVDLGSTNGTVLDGAPLAPFQEARLEGRHELRISDLPLVISVVSG